MGYGLGLKSQILNMDIKYKLPILIMIVFILIFSEVYAITCSDAPIQKNYMSIKV